MKKVIYSLALVAAVASCKKEQAGTVQVNSNRTLYTEKEYEFTTDADAPDDAVWLINGKEIAKGKVGLMSFEEDGENFVDLVTKPGKRSQKSHAHRRFRVFSIYRSLGRDLNLAYVSTDTTTNNFRWNYGRINKIGDRKMELRLSNNDGEFQYLQFDLVDTGVGTFDTEMTYQYTYPVNVYGTKPATGSITYLDNYLRINMVTDEGEFKELFYTYIYY